MKENTLLIYFKKSRGRIS